MTHTQKLKAINKVLMVLSIHFVNGKFGMQFRVPYNMTYVNPMFQGMRTITFAYFNTIEQCVDSEHKRVVLNKKVKGGSINDNLIKL